MRHAHQASLVLRGRRRVVLGVVELFGVASLLTGASGVPVGAMASRAMTHSRDRVANARVITAVGAENEYADVIRQIGGRFVHVTSILNNPNTDPHTFESSPSVAGEISSAQLIVQNGLGYDTFMNKIESASSNAHRKVIIVQNLLGLAGGTPNPHLWYSPSTMPAVALALARDLAGFDPSEAGYFEANLTAFIQSMTPWLSAIVAFSARHPGVSVATTEPVADSLLQALGANNRTPFGMQADIMNGVDPSPQDITLEDNLFTRHEVKVFIYNEQVVDSLTDSFKSAAQHAGIPIVGVYETMPTPGYDYQSWMLAEVHAVDSAVTNKTSTVKL
jgi:zinc/manganese transport system substrate-binding protein